MWHTSYGVWTTFRDTTKYKVGATCRSIKGYKLLQGFRLGCRFSGTLSYRIVDTGIQKYMVGVKFRSQTLGALLGAVNPNLGFRELCATYDPIHMFPLYLFVLKVIDTKLV